MHPIEETARHLAGARIALAPVMPLLPAARPGDAEDAYRVQAAVHALLAPTRIGARVGYKIGCTTKVMQDYLGVDAPISAGLFAGTVHDDHASLRFDDYRRPGIECEIAVRVGRDLVGGPHDVTSVAGAVEAYMPAIEVVDDRYDDWRTTDTPTLIADDFFAAGAVLGASVAARSVGDPATLTGVVTINGVEAGRGVGSDVLGHPLSALAWLATALSRRGKPLRKGEIVLLGSLVETRWVKRGDRVRVTIDRLGQVEATVA